MLRIAILGAGWSGMRHFEAIRELGRKVCVDCIVDNDADLLKAKAEELLIAKTHTDYHDALADPDVDAVSICLLYYRLSDNLLLQEFFQLFVLSSLIDQLSVDVDKLNLCG